MDGKMFLRSLSRKKAVFLDGTLFSRSASKKMGVFLAGKVADKKETPPKGYAHNIYTIIRRISAASSASARLSKKVEAAGTPGPTEGSDRHAPDRGCQRQLTGVKIVAKKKPGGQPSLFLCLLQAKQIYLLSAVATSTAQATVQPTIGLLPMPRNPIISTCAGTDDKQSA